MLLIDRYLGGHFFDTQAGGSAALWMHFFWIFGHPEVYVLVLPAFAFVSEIIPVFSRKADLRLLRSWSRRPSAIGVHQHERVGPPHVHGRHELPAPTRSSCSPRWRLPCRRGSRSSTGWRRCGAAGSSSRRRCCSAIAFLFQFLIAGLTGIMLGVGAVRLAARQLVFRGRSLPLRDRRRHPLRALRAPSITGSRR